MNDLYIRGFYFFAISLTRLFPTGHVTYDPYRFFMATVTYSFYNVTIRNCSIFIYHELNHHFSLHPTVPRLARIMHVLGDIHIHIIPGLRSIFINSGKRGIVLREHVKTYQ